MADVKSWRLRETLLWLNICKYSQTTHERQMFRILITESYGNHPERECPGNHWQPNFPTFLCGEAAKTVTALGKHDLTCDCGDDHSLRLRSGQPRHNMQ